MPTFTFSPPTVPLPFRGLIERWGTEKGQTVYRYGGTWYQTQDPFWGNETTTGIKDADVAAPATRPAGERTDNTDRDRYLFLGGRVYTVSAAMALELIDAGYTITQVGDPEIPPVDVGPGDPLTWDLLSGTWDELVGTWGAL